MGVSNSLFSLCFAMSLFVSGQLRWGGSVYIALVLSVYKVGYNLKFSKKVDTRAGYMLDTVYSKIAYSGSSK